MSEIEFKKYLDPDYIEKSRKSICKNCINNSGFNGEFYDCNVVFYKGCDVDVSYKKEGVFHTQIISCSDYEEELIK